MKTLRTTTNKVFPCWSRHSCCVKDIFSFITVYAPYCPFLALGSFTAPVRVRSFFVYLNKVHEPMPESFLVPGDSVTLDPIRFWVQRCFYILFPDRLTRHLFQPHFPGEAPNRTYAPGHLLFKLNRTSQSRHIFQTLLAE